MSWDCAEFQKVKLWNSETFNKKCLGQMKHCLDLMNQSNGDKIGRGCFECLCYCLEQTVHYPDLSRDVALNVIGNLIPVTLKLLNGKNVSEALNCLQSCMRYFRGSCNSFKNDIKLALIALIDSKHAGIIRNVGACLGAFVEVGSAGENGNNYSNNFFDLLNLLLSGIDRCVNVLLSTEESLFQMLNSSSSSNLDVLPSLQKYDFKNKVTICQRRYINLTCCLSIVLRYPFQYCTPIPLREILSVIYETIELATSKSCPTVSEIVGEDVSILIIFPLLNLLASLVVSCETNILYYDASIHKLILFLLKSHEITDDPNVDPVSCNLRGECYQLLTVWLKKFQGRASSDHAPYLLGHIMKDIDTFDIKLTGVEKVLSKKASKTILKMSQSNEVMQETLKCPPARVKLCCEALVLLDTLLVCSGPLLQLQIVKKVSDKLLLTSSKLHGSHQIPFPYTDRQCRILLYTALSSLLLLSHPSLPIPLHLVVSLISEGRNDPDFEVSYCCHKKLSTAMLTVHPFFPVRSSYSHYNSCNAPDGLLDKSGHSDAALDEYLSASNIKECHFEPLKHNENAVSVVQESMNPRFSIENSSSTNCQTIDSEANQGFVEREESSRDSMIQPVSTTMTVLTNAALTTCENIPPDLDQAIFSQSDHLMDTSVPKSAESASECSIINGDISKEGEPSAVKNDVSVQDMLSCFVDDPPDDD